MRVLGIDFGDRHIGLAVSDELGLTAQALESYHTKSEKEDKTYFKRLVEQYNIEKIVLGFPLRMDGTLGTRALKTQDFAQWLEKTLKLPVILWDERLTTKQALRILSQQKMKRKAKKGKKDQISAIIILSAYLESKRGKSHVAQNH
jgi:putative Holliday junction resolvase